MIVLSLLLVLGSTVALVVGLISDGQLLIWASIAASIGAAIVLSLAVLRRRGESDDEEADQVVVPIPSATVTIGLPGQHRGMAAGARTERAGPGGAHPARDTNVRQLRRPPEPPDEPPQEDVSASDALRVLDLLDEVLVVDGRPRYHLPGCRSLIGRHTIALPVSEARRAEFTPCAWCHPDQTLADRSRG